MFLSGVLGTGTETGFGILGLCIRISGFRTVGFFRRGFFLGIGAGFGGLFSHRAGLCLRFLAFFSITTRLLMPI